MPETLSVHVAKLAGVAVTSADGSGASGDVGGLFNSFEGLKPADASGVADANAGGAVEAESVAAGEADTVGGAGTAE
jgi:hypothetical protein